MYKKYGKAEFGVGYINDEYVIMGVNELEHGNNRLVKKFSLKMWSDPENGADLYEYKDYLLTLEELKVEYLKEYYDVK